MTEADNSQTKAPRPFRQVFKELMNIMEEYANHPEAPPEGARKFTWIWDVVGQNMPEYGGDKYKYYFPEELEMKELDPKDDKT